MLTLGIHDGHTATAAIFENGKIVACISEERLNRQKEWAGFPELAISKCLEITKTRPEDFDAIGICSFMPQIGHKDYDNPNWLKKLSGYSVRVIPRSLLQSERNIHLLQAVGRLTSKKRKEFYRRQLQKLGFTCPHFFYEHHDLHAASAFYTNWHRPQQCLVITLDGSGDGVCGSINVGGNGRISRLAGVFNYNSICEFYTRITEYLGMKPMSHEYKLMGMAPYADGQYRDNLLQLFRSYYKVSESEPLQFINTTGKWKWLILDLLQDVLNQKRFDNISGAVQDLFEEVILKWIQNAISQTGVHDLALSGGGFMNVKLNGKILNLPEVHSLFVFPSCGDESNPIGASIKAALDVGFDHREIEALGTTYWGPEYSNGDVKKEIDRLLPKSGFTTSFHEDIDKYVGRKVANGAIVGRLVGRMEWGARALGNRSIIADPRSPKVIQRINKAVKMRDFWMPFAPAVLTDFRNKYLKLRDNFHCSFMTMACETTREAYRDIPAALHPFDQSARPEVVDQKLHPRFYRMIKSFEKETGVGGVLNTSFNIHGDPIVCSPEDAIQTLISSDLDAVQLENFFVERIRG